MPDKNDNFVTDLINKAYIKCGLDPENLPEDDHEEWVSLFKILREEGGDKE